MKVIQPRVATESELRLFHAEYYVNFLKLQNDDINDDDDLDDEQLEFGIGYDCRKLNNLWKFAITVAGGNGVENAFAYTKRAFTLSFHQYEYGFFPSSGNVSDCGLGQGRGYAANFPYKSGVSVNLFVEYFNRVANLVNQTYKPDICVIQCGGDSIVGDPLGNTNLVPTDLGKCVSTILKWAIPTLFWGGGGYNKPNTSRYWTYLTSIICKTPISDDIPDDDNDYFLIYGPAYELTISPKATDDLITVKQFEDNYTKIKQNLIKYNVADV